MGFFDFLTGQKSTDATQSTVNQSSSTGTTLNQGDQQQFNASDAQNVTTQTGTQTGSQTGTNTTNQTTDQNQTQKQTGKTDTTSSQTTQSLDDATQKLLQSIIQNIGGNATTLNNSVGGAVSSFLPTLANANATAQSGGQNISDIIKAVTGASEQSYKENQGRAINSTNDYVGANDGSFGILSKQQGDRNQSTALGGVIGNVILQQEAQNTAATNAATGATTAVGGVASQLDNLLGSFGVPGALKGSTVTSSGAQSTNSLSDLVSALTGVSGTTSNTGLSTSSTTAGSSTSDTTNQSVQELLSQLLTNTSSSSSSSSSGSGTSVTTPGIIDFANLISALRK